MQRDDVPECFAKSQGSEIIQEWLSPAQISAVSFQHGVNADCDLQGSFY